MPSPGDDAAAAGMPLVPGSLPAADLNDEDNTTRDLIAQGPDNWMPGVTPVAVGQGGTGATTAAGARTNLGAAAQSQVSTDGNTATANKIPIYNGSAQLTAVSPTLSGHVATKGYVDSHGQLVDGGTFLRADGKNLGTTGDLFASGSLYTYGASPAVSSYVAAYINGDGRLGKGASSRRFKKEIKAWSPDRQAVLALHLVTFRYKAAVFGDANAPVEVGLIAEDLHDLGLSWLVFYDDEGLPAGIHYERIALALLPVVQDHEARLIALEARA